MIQVNPWDHKEIWISVSEGINKSKVSTLLHKMDDSKALNFYLF